jgi:hypothetical protein
MRSSIPSFPRPSAPRPPRLLATLLASLSVLAISLFVTRSVAQDVAEAARSVDESEEVADEDPREAELRALLEGAVAEYDAARYQEALALFRRAHELAPTARTWRSIGMAAFESGLYVEALRALRASLTETERPLTEAMRAHVQRLIERTEVFVATLDVDVSPPEASFLVDGATPVRESDGSILLDQGRHSISIADDAAHHHAIEVNLVGGTRRTVVLRAESLGGGSTDPLLISGISLLVAGGLGAVAAIATGLYATGLRGQLENGCTGFVCPGELESARDDAANLALATDVTGAVSGVVMASGLVLLVVAVTQQTAPPVSLACGPDGCAAWMRGTF